MYRVSWLSRKKKYGVFKVKNKLRKYRTIPAKRKILQLEKNESVVFAQHLVHRELDHQESNLSFIVYVDSQGVIRQNNSTTQVNLSKRRK